MAGKETNPDRVVENATEARQASWGRPVLIVLVCGLVLAGVAWAGLGIWGEQIDNDNEPMVSTSPELPAATSGQTPEKNGAMNGAENTAPTQKAK